MIDTHKYLYNSGRAVMILRDQFKCLENLICTMNDLERHIPQFHRQPGLMREFDKGFTDLRSAISCVLALIEIKEETKPPRWGEDEEDE